MTASTESSSAAALSDQALAERVGYVLIKLGETVTQIGEQVLAPLGLTGRKFNLLATVAAGGTLSQRDIAGRLGLDPNAVGDMLDELENAGLVSRRRNREDRRRHVVLLTPAGEQAFAAADARVHDAERGLLEPLTGDEADLLYQHASRILTHYWQACQD